MFLLSNSHMCTVCDLSPIHLTCIAARVQESAVHYPVRPMATWAGVVVEAAPGTVLRSHDVAHLQLSSTNKLSIAKQHHEGCERSLGTASHPAGSTTCERSNYACCPVGKGVADDVCTPACKHLPSLWWGPSNQPHSFCRRQAGICWESTTRLHNLRPQAAPLLTHAAAGCLPTSVPTYQFC